MTKLSGLMLTIALAVLAVPAAGAAGAPTSAIAPPAGQVDLATDPVERVAASEQLQIDEAAPAPDTGVPQVLDEHETIRRDLIRLVERVDALSPVGSAEDDAAAAELAKTIAEIEGLDTAGLEAYAAMDLAAVLRMLDATEAMAARQERPIEIAAADLPVPYGTRVLTETEVQELEGFRAELDLLFADLQARTPLVAPYFPDYETQIIQGRNVVAGFTSADLAIVEEGFAGIPNWQEFFRTDPFAPGAGGAVLAGAEGVQAPDGVVPTDHLGTTQCAPVVLGDTVGLYVAKGFSVATSALSDALNSDIKITVFGVGVSIPNPFKIILTLLALIPAQFANAMEAEIDINTYCTEVEHRDLFHDHDQRQLYKFQIFDDDLARHDANLTTRADTIDAFLARFRKLAVRLSIEENLLEDYDDRVSLFQRPQAAESHYFVNIETVRTIVADTILMNTNSGMSVNNAQAEYGAAEIHYAAGRWKMAYERYRNAYQEAVRQ